MAKDWLAKLQKLEGAVLGDYNPHNHVIRTPSPSVNFTFGNKGHGLPLGYGAILYGVPKGGKSLLCTATAGQLHKDDPEAFVVRFDTEFRAEGQLVASDYETWGIDKTRYITYSANSPMLIFDRIEKELNAMVQDGMPLKLVIIDSISSIAGRRFLNADTVETVQIGDHAATIKDGLSRILPIQRKHRFAVLATCQARAEMDPIMVKRGNKIKMQGAFPLQHHFEYFLSVTPNLNKEGRTDLSGNELVNDELTDLRDKSDQTGQKIVVKMMENSCGPKGRTGEFTLDFQKGIVSQYEEIFLLGKNRGVLERPNNTTYVFGDRKFVGLQNMLNALKDEPELANAILFEVLKRDKMGAYIADDAKAETE
jgi:RecA/RadA recombinase